MPQELISRQGNSYNPRAQELIEKLEAQQENLRQLCLNPEHRRFLLYIDREITTAITGLTTTDASEIASIARLQGQIRAFRVVEAYYDQEQKKMQEKLNELLESA